MTVLLALLLAGCPKGSPPPASADALPARTDLGVPGDPLAPAVCIAGVPEAGPLPPDARAPYDEALALLKTYEVSGAVAALSEAGDHPAVRAATGAAALFADRPEEAAATYEALVAELPDDGCVLRTAALAAWVGGDVAEARSRAERAWEAAPDDPEAGYLLALILGEEDRSQAIGQLEAVLSAHPDHGPSHFAVAMVLLDREEVEEGVDHLERAYRAGLPIAPLLADAYRYSGRTGDALRLQSEMGAPLGDDGRIAASADPWATYFEVLGLPADARVEAVIDTSLGELRCELFPRAAPVTVASFVGLARGTRTWTHPETGEERTDPLYPQTGFHRVIPGFMVQAGDPAGDGSGGPGYRFGDEIDPELRFDRPGVLAMANTGPGTNGSQFFVTEVPTPHLYGRHTVFGQCDEAAVAVVREMTAVPTDEDARPVEPITIEEVRIEARD